MADNTNQAQQNADAQRRAEEQRKAQQGQQAGQRQAGNTGVAGPQGSQPGDQARRAAHDEEKKRVAERPQQSGNEGSKPTPTQQENDEIRAGFRHIDDKEDDGSGPDYQYGVRRLEPSEAKGKYETR